MFLTSLELTGFKSFAKRTVLKFEPGITAIVGPNGSGKSNIADSLRWVLGAQSKKAVRGKVSSDVIFSGTSARPAMSVAEVSLNFDNRQHLLPYDFDEVVVTRRLYRSGDSEYLVNGSKVRLTDLHHAFAVAGIGAENYTVISQGMVDSVLSQSPKERRSLFEEAAGVRQFYIKRDEAKRRMTETATNLGRVEDVLRELEPRLRLLRRQTSALAKREEVEGKLRDTRLAFYGRQYRELASQRDEVRGKQDELNKEFMAMTKELEKLNAEVQELRKTQQGLTLNKLLNERNELRDGREALQAKVNAAVTDKEVARTTSERLEVQVPLLEQRLSDMTAPVSEAEGAAPADDTLQQEIAAVQAKLKALDEAPTEDAGPADFSEALEVIEQSVSKLKQAITDQAPYDALAKQAEELAKQVDNSKTAAQAGTAEGFKALLDKRAQLSDELSELKIKAETNRLRGEQRAQQKNDYEAVSKELATAKQDLAQAAERIAVADKATLSASGKLSELEAQLKLLDGRISTEQQRSFGESDELAKREEALQAKVRTQEAYRSELSEHNVTLAKLDTRLDDLTREAKAKLGEGFPPGKDDELPAVENADEELIAKLEKRLLEMGGIDPGAIAEHKEVEERFTFLNDQAEDLRKAKADLERVIRELEKKSRTLFTEAFAKINTEFGRYFEKLFGGGKAELNLIQFSEEDDDGEEKQETADVGIEIKATPPGKRLKSLAMLSGGERALTSTALLFAILTVNPSPFVMLDEVDAALDEANTARFASVLGELAERTQFLVVTHNRDSMQAAAMLYGVSMDSSGVSTMLSLKLPEAEKATQTA